MKREIRDKWVEALKSGDYKKTTGQLSEVISGKQCFFCALGVLQDLYNKEHGLEWDNKTSELNVCSPDVVKWSGFNGEDEKLEYDYHDGHVVEDYIYEFNDSYELDFETIADLIEAQL